MAIIKKARLNQYLKLGYNVLFSGFYGVGKTAIIKEVFEDSGLRWKYFSASTLDPWVDFVGIPKVIDKDGKSVLELVRPSFIENDEVDAIYIDELNRAPEKVINAIMELIQFKSINGHKLKNLKVIWAATQCEDDDDTYAVNHLDPAHLDRFQVKIHVPYEVDEEYFLTKYPLVGQQFIDWWKEIPAEIQKEVSPRRLDYAADAYQNDCRLEDFLPQKSNVSKLRTMLKTIPFHASIGNIKDSADAEKFLKNVNNATTVLNMVKNKDSVAIDFFTKYGEVLPGELTAPVAEYVFAHKNGLTVISSLEELIEKLPNENGDQSTAALINNVDLDLLYSSGKNNGNLENDLRALLIQKQNLVKKLTNRIADVLITCQAKTLMRILWGQDGKIANRPTNIHKLALLLNKVNANLFTVKQKNWINKKLYEKQLVDQMHFLLHFL